MSYRWLLGVLLQLNVKKFFSLNKKFYICTDEREKLGRKKRKTLKMNTVTENYTKFDRNQAMNRMEMNYLKDVINKVQENTTGENGIDDAEELTNALKGIYDGYLYDLTGLAKKWLGSIVAPTYIHFRIEDEIQVIEKEFEKKALEQIRNKEIKHN